MVFESVYVACNLLLVFLNYFFLLGRRVVDRIVSSAYITQFHWLLANH